MCFLNKCIFSCSNIQNFSYFLFVFAFVFVSPQGTRPAEALVPPPCLPQLSALLSATLRLTRSQVRRRVVRSKAESRADQPGGLSDRGRRAAGPRPESQSASTRDQTFLTLGARPRSASSSSDGASSLMPEVLSSSFCLRHFSGRVARKSCVSLSGVLRTYPS